MTLVDYKQYWICSLCNSGNIDSFCHYCKAWKSKAYKLSEFSINHEISMRLLSTGGVFKMPIDRDEALFMKFFNHEDVMVKDMSIEQLSAHIDELENIIYEAKVRHQKSTGVRKNRVERLSQEERDKLITNPDFNSSERSKLEIPKRDKRSRADKLLDDLTKLGIDPLTRNALIGNVIVNEETKAEPIRPKNQSQTSTVDRVLVDRRVSFNENSKRAVNTHTSLLNEYLSNNNGEYWKNSCIRLDVIEPGLVKDILTTNALTAEKVLLERYRTIFLLARRALDEQGLSYVDDSIVEVEVEKEKEQSIKPETGFNPFE